MIMFSNFPVRVSLIGLFLALLYLATVSWFPASAASDAVNCNAADIICRSGAITANETWQAGKVYVLTNDLTVGPGATLTIDPGVIVKALYGCCNDFYEYRLVVEGTLNVNGTADKKVYFTSERDDAVGGDTDNNGGSTPPKSGDWGDIVFKSGSQGILKFTEIRYSDSRKGGAIRLEGSSPTLDNVTIRHSTWAAISALPSDSPTITNFAAENVVLGGMEIRSGGLTTDATWDQTSIVYILTNDFTVGSGATLTIQPGVTIKALYGCCNDFYEYSLLVEGTLNVNGTASQKVYFTSIRDDAIKGDTNNDSGDTQAKSGDWGSIIFKSGSQGTVKFAEIRNSDSQKRGAIHLEGSSPTLQNLTVRNSSWAAISALPSDAPTITNFAAENAVLGGMEIRAGSLTTDATWDQSGIVYILTKDFTVGNSATLTIQPGVVIKAVYGCCNSFLRQSFTVEGHLVVNGTKTNNVVFTSSLDDAIGGDTNNDAGTTQPKAGDWEGFQFLSGSSGSFNYTVIRYAGVSNTYGAVNVKAATVNLTNSVLSNSIIGLLVDGSLAQRSMAEVNAPTSISKSSLLNNSEFSILTKSEGTVIANSNWWGGNTGPGQQVSGNVTVEDWCSDEACSVILKPSSIYLPLVQK